MPNDSDGLNQLASALHEAAEVVAVLLSYAREQEAPPRPLEDAVDRVIRNMMGWSSAIRERTDPTPDLH